MILELFIEVLSLVIVYFKRLGCEGRLAQEVNIEETGANLIACVNSTAL